MVYTGTHDNETLKQWFEAKTAEDQEKGRKFLRKAGVDTRHIVHAFIVYAMERNSELAIIPISDLMGLGEEGRINRPGTVGDPNWKWRLVDYNRLKKQKDFLKKTIQNTGRV